MIIRILIVVNFNMAHVTTGLLTSLMVFILIMQGNISRTAPVSGEKNEIGDFESECRTDNDCTESNSFCDSNLHLCSQCLDCKIYFRTPKKNIECPRDISDCSTCLDGYFEEMFFGGEIRDTCVPVESNVLPTPAKIQSNSYWEQYGIIFMIINVSVFSLFFLTWAYFYKRIRSINSIITSNSVQGDPDNQLPSYDSCMKLDNFVTDDQEFHLFTGEQPPRNEWRHQNAVPFSWPFPEETDNTSDEGDNDEEVDGVVQREIEVPELHEEDTMPSSWSPLPAPQQLPENSGTNFQNIDSDNCQQPPSKRMRLAQQTDEKTRQDEDNTSDVSEDMSQDDL